MLSRKSIVLAVLSAALSLPALAQQQPLWSSYMFNQQYYNPATVGVRGFTTLTAMHRTQWAGYQGVTAGGAPSTQFVSVDAPILRYNAGAGVNVSNDNLGPLNNQEVQLLGAYHFGLDDDIKLSIGARAGIFAQSINTDIYSFVDEGDPVLDRIGETLFRPDFGVGVHLQAEDYFGGVGFNSLNNARFNWGSDDIRNSLSTHAIIHGGYVLEVLQGDMTITPQTLIRTDFNEFSFDLTGMFHYKQRLKTGLSYRWNEGVIGLVGYSFLKSHSLYLGGAFDLVVQNTDAKQLLSYELVMSYRLPVATGVARPQVKTPRFEFQN